MARGQYPFVGELGDFYDERRLAYAVEPFHLRAATPVRANLLSASEVARPQASELLAPGGKAYFGLAME